VIRSCPAFEELADRVDHQAHLVGRADARCLRNSRASSARAAASPLAAADAASAKSSSRKLAMDGWTVTPNSRRRSRVHSRQTSLWRRLASTKPGSSTAAAPATWAAALTLNGPRTRFRTPATAAGQ
jgi:hypothetical protein